MANIFVPTYDWQAFFSLFSKSKKGSSTTFSFQFVAPHFSHSSHGVVIGPVKVSSLPFCNQDVYKDRFTRAHLHPSHLCVTPSCGM